MKITDKQRDIVTGIRSRRNPLNKEKLTDDELDDIMLSDDEDEGDEG